MLRDHLTIEQLKGYRDRDLPLGDLVVVDTHLASCPECRGQLAGIAALSASASVLSGVREAIYKHLSYEQMDDWVEDRLDQSERNTTSVRQLPGWFSK